MEARTRDGKAARKGKLGRYQMDRPAGTALGLVAYHIARGQGLPELDMVADREAVARLVIDIADSLKVQLREQGIVVAVALVVVVFLVDNTD